MKGINNVKIFTKVDEGKNVFKESICKILLLVKACVLL